MYSSWQVLGTFLWELTPLWATMDTLAFTIFLINKTYIYSSECWEKINKTLSFLTKERLKRNKTENLHNGTLESWNPILSIFIPKSRSSWSKRYSATLSPHFTNKESDARERTSRLYRKEEKALFPDPISAFSSNIVLFMIFFLDLLIWQLLTENQCALHWLSIEENGAQR